MRYILAAIQLVICTTALSAEPRPACSGSAFLASNYYWSGIPVMRNASQPAGDAMRCLYVVPVSVALAEEWHRKKLAEEGWRPTKRDAKGRDIELEFRNAERVVRVVISDVQFATTVLVKRPVVMPAATTGRAP